MALKQHDFASLRFRQPNKVVINTTRFGKCKPSLKPPLLGLGTSLIRLNGLFHFTRWYSKLISSKRNGCHNPHLRILLKIKTDFGTAFVFVWRESGCAVKIIKHPLIKWVKRIRVSQKVQPELLCGEPKCRPSTYSLYLYFKYILVTTTLSGVSVFKSKQWAGLF